MSVVLTAKERDLRPHVGWRAMFQHCMWTVSGFLAFWLLGFRVNILGQQASREEARILVVAPHSSFMDVFTIALCYASPVARIENSKTWFLWAPQAIGHTIFVDRLAQNCLKIIVFKFMIKFYSKYLP